MTAVDLVTKCIEHGVELSPADGKLWIDPVERLPDGLLDDLKQHKHEIITYLTRPEHIPCQVQWLECDGPEAPTTLIPPKRFGFTASPDQVAAACDSCKRCMQDRSKRQHFAQENDLLWGVFRTQQIINNAGN